MINLARGSVILGILFVIMGMIYTQFNAETVLAIANDSQTNLIQEDKKIVETEINAVVDDKKLVKKTALVSKKGNARSFRATAYCLKGITASGSRVRRGIVAADPRLLPLGTRIYVNAGAYSGNYTVTDTGGVIKGNILDIWVPTCGEAVKFGRRSISVSVLGK